MCSDESRRGVQFVINADGLSCLAWLPVKFKGFKMKVLDIIGLCKPLSKNRDDTPVVKIRDDKLLRARVWDVLVEWNKDCNQ